MNSVLACAVGVLLASSALVAQGDVIRKGEGARRQQLTAMELKPFAVANWSSLTDWTNGKAIDSASMAGKPVLVVTWAGWRDISVKGLKIAKKVAEKYGSDGLIVVGVHAAEGWADAEKPTAASGTFVLAHDAKGEFRKAILSDADPDFYVIDRAGQMRYARIVTESVEEAVATVVKETAEQATNTNARIAENAAAARVEAAKTSGINQSVDLTGMPEQPYTQPDEDVYSKAGFKKYSVVQRDAINKFDDVKHLVLPEETFFPKKPETQGRCVVVYFWSWLFPRSYDPAMEAMEHLQRKYGRDVVFIGVWSPFKLDGVTNDYIKQELKEEQEPEKVIAKIRKFTEDRKFQHTLLADPTSVVLTNARSNDLKFTYFEVPYAAVASSEGVIRFQGSSHWPEFVGAIDEVLLHDPGVKLRRAAEEKWINAQAAKAGGGKSESKPAPAGEPKK